VTTAKNPEMKQRVDAHLDSLIEKFYREVPFATHQKSSPEINLTYFKRHNVETILRLRMKRTIDALTIHYFTKHNPQLAKVWAHYAEDEMLHDSLFLADLRRAGMTPEEVYATEPLFATKLLQGYFYYGIEQEGKPLASLCSSYFIEYTTLRTQPAWIENISRVLGDEYVKGQRAHVSIDEGDEHADFVWDVIAWFVSTPGDEQVIIGHLDNVYKLFVAYFRELHDKVILGASDASTELVLETA
jgi:hypothetical protein